MKKELIKTDNYLLVVDDSEIKEGDFYFNIVRYTIQQYKNQDRINDDNWKKVIAHLPFGMYSTLEGVPLLPSLEQEDKELYYQKQVMQPYSVESQSYTSYENGFIDGYNKAREKYKYTEEDIIKSMNHAVCFSESNSDLSVGEYAVKFKKWADKFIQSLSQPKMPTHFEFEMEVIGVTDDGVNKIEEPKTTTNSQGQQVVCGKYIYEI